MEAAAAKKIFEYPVTLQAPVVSPSFRLGTFRRNTFFSDNLERRLDGTRSIPGLVSVSPPCGDSPALIELGREQIAADLKEIQNEMYLVSGSVENLTVPRGTSQDESTSRNCEPSITAGTAHRAWSFHGLSVKTARGGGKRNWGVKTDFRAGSVTLGPIPPPRSRNDYNVRCLVGTGCNDSAG